MDKLKIKVFFYLLYYIKFNYFFYYIDIVWKERENLAEIWSRVVLLPKVGEKSILIKIVGVVDRRTVRKV